MSEHVGWRVNIYMNTYIRCILYVYKYNLYIMGLWEMLE